MSNITFPKKLIHTDSVKYFLTHENSFVNINSYTADDSHIHDCIEVYLNISGDVSFLVKNKIYPISRGDIVLTRASEFHHCIYHSSCTHEHFCLWINDSIIGELTKFIGNSAINHIKFSLSEREETIKLFASLLDADAKDDTLSSTSAFLNILMKIKQKTNEPFSASESNIPDDFKKVLDYINLHYSDITSISDLSNKMFVSLSTLNRQFRKHLHITPKSYLETVKLSNARRLLSEGKSVTDVCFECGYCDSSHFIRIFKKKFGVTPRRYKDL